MVIINYSCWRKINTLQHYLNFTCLETSSRWSLVGLCTVASRSSRELEARRRISCHSRIQATASLDRSRSQTPRPASNIKRGIRVQKQIQQQQVQQKQVQQQQVQQKQVQQKQVQQKQVQQKQVQQKQVQQKQVQQKHVQQKQVQQKQIQQKQIQQQSPMAIWISFNTRQPMIPISNKFLLNVGIRQLVVMHPSRRWKCDSDLYIYITLYYYHKYLCAL